VRGGGERVERGDSERGGCRRGGGVLVGELGELVKGLGGSTVRFVAQLSTWLLWRGPDLS
jgi:hypothetical protein